MQELTAEWLAAFPSMVNVPLPQIQWFIENGELQALPAGTSLFLEGEPVSAMYLVITGKINIISAQKRIVAVLEAGDFTGLLPFSRMKHFSSNGIALLDTKLLMLSAAHLPTLIREHYELTEALVHIMISRVRDFTSLQQQNEKMMALGKLSAGLAHELNNPASAIVRDAQALKKHLSLMPDSFNDIMSIQVTSEQVNAVNDVLFERMAKERPNLSLMERMEREEELEEWFTDHDVEDESLTETFTDFGYCANDLEQFAAHIPRHFLRTVLKWVSDNILTDKMVGDIGEAAQRIGTLVASVKSFTHMDRGQDAQYADIHTGITNTLTMLGHKIRQGNVQVATHYDGQLPQVKALIGELNQVWTNLLDNALDALEGSADGRLDIATFKDGPFVRVTITDNGPGIPQEIADRIFDPFFTTKDIGKGTGLGLDVVQRIVQQHRGSVKVTSAPGRTSFAVCFPIDG